MHTKRYFGKITYSERILKVVLKADKMTCRGNSCNYVHEIMKISTLILCYVNKDYKT